MELNSAKKLPPLFRDPLLQHELDTEGFVKIQLLEPEQVNLLQSLFQKYHGNMQAENFQASSYINNIALKHEIRDALFPIFEKQFERLFQNFSYFGSSFLYKPAGEKSALAPHQDWTIVDEKQAVALNIWSPLIDSDEKNGTLQVIPRSHSNYIFSIRAPTIPFFFQNYYNEVYPFFKPIPTKAGEAIVLNQSLLHYSGANRSSQTRIAITSGIKTKGMPMHFYYKVKDGLAMQLEKFEMPEDFLISFENFETDIYARPKGRSLGIETYRPPSINAAQFRKLFGNHSEKSFSLISKFKSLFQ